MCWHTEVVVSRSLCCGPSVRSAHSCLQEAQQSAWHAAVSMACSCFHGAQTSASCFTWHTALCMAHRCLRVHMWVGMNIWLRAGSGCVSVCSNRILAAPFLPQQIHLNRIYWDLFRVMIFLRRGWNSRDLQHLSHQGHSSSSPWARWSVDSVLCAGGCQTLQMVSHQLLTCLWIQTA